jgi:hypothetical protein
MSFRLARRAGIILAVAAANVPGFAMPALAVPVITSPGVLMDLGSGWRTSSVSKAALALDGNGVLGNDGYWTFGSNGKTLKPAYISTVSIANSVYGGNSSYALIDNPTTTPGASATTVLSGTLNPTVRGLDGVFTFTLSGTVPSLIRVGLMIDNLDVAAYNPAALQLVDTTNSISGPSVATTSSAFNDRVPDWVFFDIASGAAGEVFTVDVSSGTNGCNCLGAVSFDSSSATSVPEPSSVAVLGLGLASLLAAARRSRSRSISTPYL